VHVNAKVQEAAQAMRTVINRVKTAQQELGLLPPDAELKAMGQTSYFRACTRWGKSLASAINSAICWLTGGHVVRKPCPAKMPKSPPIPYQPYCRGQNSAGVRQRLYGESAGQHQIAYVERSRSPDERLSGERCKLRPAASYPRSLSEIELTRTFGNKSLDSQLAAIQDEYDALMRLRPAEQEKLAKAREADLRDILALRDRLVGTYGMPDDPSSFFVRAGAFCVAPTL
jgi:hypothetical protein